MPGAHAAEDEHPVLADRQEVLRLQLEPLPLAGEVVHVLGEPLVAAVGLGPAGEQPGHRRDLDLLVGERDQRVEIALGERRVGAVGFTLFPRST